MKQNEIVEAARNAKIDILALQETYVNNVNFIKNFDQIHKVKSFWSFSIGRSSGVAILLFGRYSELAHRHVKDCEGRILGVDLRTGHRLLNIYAPVRSGNQISFYDNIDYYVGNARKLIILGDFNCVDNEAADRIPGRVRNATYGAKSWLGLKARCNLVDCWSKIHPGYPQMTWKGGKFCARLDKICVTENMCEEVISTSIVKSPLSDHQMLVATLRISNVPRGRGLWQLNVGLLNDPRVDVEIKSLMEKKVQNGINPTEWDMMKAEVRNVLIKWGKVIAREDRQALKRVGDAVMLLNKTGNKGPGLEEAKERLKRKYNDLLKKRWEDVRLRLRTEKWESENWASKFLLNKSLGISKQEITALKDDQSGRLLTDQEDIQRYVGTFYGKLYKKEGILLKEDELIFPGRTQGIDGGDFSTEELKKALGQLRNRKAPGEDGLRPAFYRKYWHLLAKPFTQMIAQAFRLNNLPMSFYEGRIVLLCKDQKTKRV